MKAKKSKKNLALLVLGMMLSLAVCVASFAACGSSDDSDSGTGTSSSDTSTGSDTTGSGDTGDGSSADREIAAVGYSASAAYTEYTDLGGYGSDFTTVAYARLTLYDDGSYEMESNSFMYAGSWSMIATEVDAQIFGTYTATYEDEYGIEVELSAASRVIYRSVVTSTTTFVDTDDGTEDGETVLETYACMGTAEIDYETYALTWEASETASDAATSSSDSGLIAVGYATEAAYIEYTDLGGYGSDFTTITYARLSLFEDGTYEMEYNYFNYAGSWSMIATEMDVRVYGTYTVSFEDEYGVEVVLSAATRALSRTVVTSSTTYVDTDTADDDGATLATYAEMGTAEIDYETYALTWDGLSE